MELSAAIQLIQKGVNTQQPGQYWVDLGAGSGLFTTALAGLLPEPGKIYAVDKDARALKSIKNSKKTVEIIPIEADFTKDKLTISNPDGIIMANSLHYVQDQLSFLQHMRRLLKPSGRFIIIEYDTEQPNPWVPWPVSFTKLQYICSELKNVTVEKIAMHPSLYRSAGMYVAVIKSEV